MKQKNKNGRFLSMLLGTLGASLLGDLLTKNLSGKGTVRAGERIKKKPLTPAHPLTNFEI